MLPMLQCTTDTPGIEVHTNFYPASVHLLHCCFGGGGRRGATACGGASGGSCGHIALTAHLTTFVNQPTCMAL